jgi:transcriptional regulator with XRE-family HTH domain
MKKEPDQPGQAGARKRQLIAGRLQGILDELGWKKKDLAEKLGKNPSEVTKWLSGSHNFTMDTLAEIEQATGKSLIQVGERTAEYPEHLQAGVRYAEEESGKYIPLQKPGVTTVLKYPLRNLHPAAIRDLQEKYPDAEFRIELDRIRSNEGMTEERFWQLIGLLDWSKQGDDAAVIEPLVKALTDSPVRHIYEFDDILSHKLFILDGLAFAREIGESAWQPDRYFSVDVFLYARCCAVANGFEHFQKLLEDPSLIPKDLDFGALLRVAGEAYLRKTSRQYVYVPAYSVETYSNEEGWKAQ